MITNKLKACCYACDHSDVETDVDRYEPVYVNNQEVFDERINCLIYCRHAKVCKTYLESEE